MKKNKLACVTCEQYDQNTANKYDRMRCLLCSRFIYLEEHQDTPKWCPKTRKKRPAQGGEGAQQYEANHHQVPGQHE